MDRNKSLAEQSFNAVESYNLKQDVFDALVQGNHIRVVTKKDNDKPVTLSVKDDRLNEGVEVKNLPFEGLEILTQYGAETLVGGDDTDKDGNVTTTAAQKVLGYAETALTIQARARARNMLIDAFGIEDETTKIKKLVDFYVLKLGISREKAERMVAANLAERDSA